MMAHVGITIDPPVNPIATVFSTDPVKAPELPLRKLLRYPASRRSKSSKVSLTAEERGREGV